MLSQTTVFTHLVRDYMGPAPVHCTPDTPCIEVVNRIREAKISSAVVVNEKDQPIGIVTEQDVCRRIAFIVTGETTVKKVMSSPVLKIRDRDQLYHAIAEMRKHKLRHMPVVDRAQRVVGVLNLDDSLAGAAGQTVKHIESLSHQPDFQGLLATKKAQKDVALELMDDTVPAPEIQWLLSSINLSLHRHVVEICLHEMSDEGLGEPPVDFDVIIMGSGGRGESYLNPDQDNGFVLENYPERDHDAVDSWFEDLAKRMTTRLQELGFDLCVGNVMATNPRWRKTLQGFYDQTMEWISQAEGDALRYCDIFFDFRHCYGSGKLTQSLRDFVSEKAQRRFFLSQLYKLDQKHRGALGLFGRLLTDPNQGPNFGKIDLKSAGTLPLVGALRLFALREGIKAHSTLDRLTHLHKAKHIDDDEADYLRGAYEHITNLLLKQQLEDHRLGNPIGNHVPPEALTSREKDMLVDAYKAIRAFHTRLGKLVT